MALKRATKSLFFSFKTDTKLVTEDSDKMFYDMEERDKAEDLSFENNGRKDESKS